MSSPKLENVVKRTLADLESRVITAFRIGAADGARFKAERERLEGLLLEYGGNLTQVARGMVGRWGMSDAIGAVAVADGRADGALLPGIVPASPLTQQLVDEEVRRIVDDAEREVIALLQHERERLDALAHALLERETLDQPEAYEVAGVEFPAVDASDQAKATAGP